MNHTDSQIPSGPTHLYLLQMDPSINISSNEQVLPLHLLDNSLEYGRKQYLLPISSKQKEGQDNLQVLIDSSQGSAKIMGLIVDKKYQDLQNSILSEDVQFKSTTLSESVAHTIEHTHITEQQPLTQTKTEEPIQFHVNAQVEHDVEANNMSLEVDHSAQVITNYVHIPDRNVPPRALAVLPNILQVQRRHIISTRRSLPVRARFGPIQGINRKITHSDAVELVLNATSNKIPLFLIKDMEESITHIDTADKDKANWIGLLPLGDQNSANVWIYEENQELYAITMDKIPPRKPLMLGYSKKYADEYGLIGPTKDLEKEPEVPNSWWCYECQFALPSAKHLETHTYMYHKDGSEHPRRRYRCRHCTRTFSRIFTLRRHTAFHCPVKLDKRNTVAATESDADALRPIVNALTCSEDNRLPSDESFQNYSNGLDFSTNLFDTDRISSLDISGNSRSDNDFNLYSIGYKDDNGLTNDLDFTSKIENCSSPSKEANKKTVEELNVPCPHCDQIVVKGKRRQHVSRCPARLVKCECKKVFTNMKLLMEHVRTQHTKEITEQNDNDNNVPAVIANTQGPQYKCEQCQHTFKRRGMLVNHLWRVHNTVSARVPLERRVRHYPCGICPKIYRTAAKRNRHLQLHHPGASKAGGQALEGGTRLCEPAMCSACPRQYATRAKLLQHQRAHHPYLVPPPTTKGTTKKNQVSRMDYDVEEGTIPRDFIEYDFAEDALDFESQLAEAQEVKFTQTLTEPLSIGSHIVCTGTPCDDLPWFAVNIGSGEPDSGRGDIAVHFNVRLPQCYVVRNTRRHNKWGPEETTAFRTFPFKIDHPFTIEILVDEKETLWAVDGIQYCSYTHRIPSPFTAEWVQITGIRDATLKIKKTDIYPMLAPTPAEVPLRASIDSLPADGEPTWQANVIASLSKGIPEGHQLVIYGRLRLLLHSFAIDFMDTPREWPRPNVLAHVNVRAYFESQKERQLVVLNAWFGEWGAERRQRTARLIPGTYTKIRIVRQPADWAIYADDVLIGELEFRAAAAGVRAVRIRGDLYPEQMFLAPASSSPLRD